MIKKFYIAVGVLTFIAGCTGQPGAKGASEELVLASVNSVNISEADVETKVPNQLRQVKMDLYNARKQGADLIISEMLVQQAAEKAGQSPEEYLQQQMAGITEITDQEVEQFYNQRKARFQDKKFDEVKGLIRGYIQQQKARQVRSQVLVQLRKDADIEWYIAAPRVEVIVAGYPSQGPENAAVTIVEFSDYQCPFCGRARSTVNQILSEYEGKVRYVFRDFPLSFHKDAQKAHEAAHCANEQEKYWEYNAKLFASQRALKVEDLKKYAKELNLDQKKFNECLDSNRYAQMVQESLAYGQTVGVSGTPAFFINGRMISGARPFEAFKEVIDDELVQAN